MKAAILAGLLALCASPTLAGAAIPIQEPAREEVSQDSALEERARQLAESIRCPVCLNLSIEASPDPLAREMKELIRERLARGESPEEIRAYFVQRYGEWILLTPEPEGLNLTLWLLPAAGLLAGAVVVWLAVRRWVGVEEAEGSDA